MSNVLYISELPSTELNGGAKIETRNKLYLSKNFDVHDAKVYAYGRKPLRKLFDLLFSKVPTLYKSKEVKKIKRIINESDAKVLFIETTKMGYFNKLAKEKGMKVVTFVHNNEEKLYRDTRGSFYVPFIKKQEKLAVENSDSMIFLNERDFNDFKKIYNLNETKNYIFPITLDDELDLEKEEILKKHKKGKIGIFFGSNFPPNYNGVKWFLDNVSKEIDSKIYIYGRGFDNHKELENDNMIIKGEVDDIFKMMEEADFFISPIFEGSGMKVKTCHALMYGKQFFGTDESLVGYNLNPKSYHLCNTKEEFIEKINSFVNSDENTFNSYARKDYLDKYSSSIFEKKLIEIINDLLN